MKRAWKKKNNMSGGILDVLFANRGLTIAEDIGNFLDPKFEHVHDPLLMRDIDLAIARIQKAMEQNQKITVYADYDADAVTAAAVLLRFFQHLDYKNIDYYIPDRFSEGYGMNVEAVREIAARGTNLIITVDCGINAFDSVLEGSALGVDTIITDHHQLTGGIPAAIAVVNPHRPDDSYPFKHLTGVGVAFKLVQALTKDSWQKWLLDLVAIGTVADCQSLLGENRILVKWGLHVMQKTRWIGLKKLMQIAGIEKGEIDTYQIGFIIAPRINAAGRLEHAGTALELLLTDDETKASELAEKLNDLNTRRQKLTEQIVSEAREQVVSLGDKKILLAAGDGWPKGIVGLVAGKLTEEFARPVLVLEKSADQATGSARSIANFNIIEAISQSSEILMRFGGHPQAAGFTLRAEHIDLFHKNLLDYAEANLSEESLEPVLHYEAELTTQQVSGELVDLLQKFEPYGQDNQRPRFRINNLRVSAVSAVGQEGKHLRLRLESLAAIGFGMGYWVAKLQPGSRVDVICEPQFNEWNGEKSVQLKIIDLHETDNLH